MFTDRHLASYPVVLLTITLLLGCGGATTPMSEPAQPAPADTPAPAPAETAGTETVMGDADPEPADPAGAAASEPDATQPTADLSAGETRTMKLIQQTVLDNRDRFRACYDAVQAKLPELQGDLTLFFVLDAEGKVKEAAVNEQRSTLKHEEIVKCAVEELRKLKFPPSSKGLETKVNYPFNFNPR
jgi:hypothetical protein